MVTVEERARPRNFVKWHVVAMMREGGESILLRLRKGGSNKHCASLHLLLLWPTPQILYGMFYLSAILTPHLILRRACERQSLVYVQGTHKNA